VPTHAFSGARVWSAGAKTNRPSDKIIAALRINRPILAKCDLATAIGFLNTAALDKSYRLSVRVAATEVIVSLRMSPKNSASRTLPEQLKL
jgi:hypothetical protein